VWPTFASVAPAACGKTTQHLEIPAGCGTVEVQSVSDCAMSGGVDGTRTLSETFF
jgi:hypothetical protein